MKLHIPKISPKSLSDKQLNTFNQLSNTQYGEELALKIADKLIENSREIDGLYFSHRDYCGLGIFVQKGKFILSTVFDGYGPHTIPDSIIATFESTTDFIRWLTKESDQSMSFFGKDFNNQTITKLRLDWFLEENYSPTWNHYCNYIRDKDTIN